MTSQAGVPKTAQVKALAGTTALATGQDGMLAQTALVGVMPKVVSKQAIPNSTEEGTVGGLDTTEGDITDVATTTEGTTEGLTSGQDIITTIIESTEDEAVFTLTSFKMT